MSSVEQFVKQLVGYDFDYNERGILIIDSVDSFGSFRERFKKQGILVKSIDDLNLNSIKVKFARDLKLKKIFLIIIIRLEPYFEIKEEGDYKAKHIITRPEIIAILSEDGELEYYLILDNKMDGKSFFYIKKLSKPVVKKKYYEKFYEREHYCLDDRCELYFIIYDKEKDKALPMLNILFEGVGSG